MGKLEWNRARAAMGVTARAQTDAERRRPGDSSLGEGIGAEGGRPFAAVRALRIAAFTGAAGIALLLAACGPPGSSEQSPGAAVAGSSLHGARPRQEATPWALPLKYDAQQACVQHELFTNTILPAGKGEFGTDGLSATYWGKPHSRTEAPVATWPGYQPSWGKFQYDTYFGNPNDGSGNTPFAVTSDTGAPGSPTALRITAEPMPSPMQHDPVYGDGWTASNITANVVSPVAGGSITIPVGAANVTHQGWQSGIGRPPGAGGGEDDPQGVVFVGTVTAGGCTVNAQGQCTGGSTSITLSNVQYFEGGPGTNIPANADFQDWEFPDYYSGALDTDVNAQYGFFVARIRLPQPLPALSPAWWMLETGGVGNNNGKLLRSEWDVQEQFAADYGYELNAGNILWNSGSSGDYSYGCGSNCPAQNNTTQPGATGVYPFPKRERADYAADYHDFGVLISPGGPAFPTDYSCCNGVYVERGDPFAGTTFFLDGYPIRGHIGQPDLTQGSPDKEIMLMFQVAFPGSWLDPHSQGLKGNPWPQYMWVQWLRAYQPTKTPC